MTVKDFTSQISQSLKGLSGFEPREDFEPGRCALLACLRAITAAFIGLLEGFPESYRPLLRLLLQFYEGLELMAAPAGRGEAASGTETVHVPGHTVAEHDYRKSSRGGRRLTEEEADRIALESAEMASELERERQAAAEMTEENERLRRENTRLQNELVERDLQSSSGTSHWPPSKDRYPGGDTFRNGRSREYDNRMRREMAGGESGKDKAPRRGGAPGHKGHSGHVLEGVGADERIELYPGEIPPEERGQYEWREGAVHRVVDCETVVKVKEYVQMETTIKGKRKPIVVKGRFPENARSETSYGTSFDLLIVFYYIIGLMSVDRISSLLRWLYGVTISPATVLNRIRKAGRLMREASGLVAGKMESLGKNPETVFVADETSLRVKGKNYYDHVLVSPRDVLHTVSPTRGLEGTYKSGVMRGFRGWLVTDFFKNYLKKPWRSAFDWAHIRRELLAARIRDPESKWVEMMLEFGYQSYKAYHLALSGERPIPAGELKRLTELYNEAINEGLRETGRIKQKTLNLLFRLRDHEAGVLAHLYNTNVPLTSNAAERQCRQIKRRMDVSGQFDTASGAEDYAAFLTVVETAKAQGLDPFDTLEQVLGGNTAYLVTGKRDESISRSVRRIMTTER